MSRKLLCECLALILVPFAAHAEPVEEASVATSNAQSGQRHSPVLRLGAKSGGGAVTLSGDDAADEMSRLVPKEGYSLGLSLSTKPFLWRVSGQVDLMYAVKGSRVELADGTDAGTFDLAYLSGALLLDFNICSSSNIRCYASGGFELGRTLKADRVGPTGNSLDLKDDTTTWDRSALLGLGAAWIPGAGGFELTAEVRLSMGLTTTDSSMGNDNDVRNQSLLGMVGVRYGFTEVPEKDTDNDGIIDARDQCPKKSEDRNDIADEDGCPDDADGDGIPDEQEGVAANKTSCKDAPEDIDGFQDTDGCPDPDNDGDGIMDEVDRCPGEAEDVNNFQDEDGCRDPDSDGDGIPYDPVTKSGLDECPKEKENKNGFDDTDGCPEKDSDEDTVPDIVENKQCSRSFAPSANGHLHNFNGIKLIKGTGKGIIGTIEVEKPIEFADKSSDAFKPGRNKAPGPSEKQLALMADALIYYSRIKKVTIADSSSSSYTETSLKRLEKVRDYLKEAVQKSTATQDEKQAVLRLLDEALPVSPDISTKKPSTNKLRIKLIIEELTEYQHPNQQQPARSPLSP